MIGVFFSTVTHGEDAALHAMAEARPLLGDAAEEPAVVASPAVTGFGPLDPDVRQISLLTPLPEGSLSVAVAAPPMRYFRDGYGAAFITQLHNAVRPGGCLILPFHSDNSAERTGFWHLSWLTSLLGQPERTQARSRLALFRRRSQPLRPPRSVLSCFLAESHAFAVDYLRDRVRAASDAYLARCADFLSPPICRLSNGPSPYRAVVDLGAEMDAFVSLMNYSVTGTGYKSAGLRRLMDEHLPRQTNLRLVDIGGGAGFVDVELLLGHHGLAEVVNCEPVAANLPLIRRLQRWFAPDLGGRWKVSLAPAEDYPFDQPVDVVCAFASLLYIPRDRRRSTLDRIWSALRPGGILVVHENIKRPLFAEKDYFGAMFTVDSLEAELGRFGPIQRYRSSDLQPLSNEAAGDLTVYRVVQKA